VIASSTGTDATLTLVTSTDAGLAPASGGGTTNFLRADGTFAAPPGGSPGGGNTQVQFNSSGSFAGDADLTWNSTTNVLGVTGDVNLSDGGTYTTTLQTITPTAARTISLPDATGTVALVAGSSGQLLWNNAGVNAGVPSSTVSSTGNITLSLNGALSATGIAGVPIAVTGTWITTGGTATTTKPQVLIEPTGATSTAWSTSGTGLGVNAASGFTGRLLDLQVNGSSRAVVTGAGQLLVGTSTARTNLFNNLFGAALQVEGTTAESKTLSVFGNQASAFGGGIISLGASRGVSVGSNTVLQSGDELGLLSFQGADGTEPVEGARIMAQVDGTPGANDMPGRLVFSTTADGAASSTERMRIKSNGVINFSNAPTYADNTAALAGGLVAGDVYKTSAGDLRITV
jgi:hypothetical protein